MKKRRAKGKLYNQEIYTTVPEALKDISYFRSFNIQKGFYPFLRTEIGQDALGNIYIEIPTMKQLLKIDEDDISPDDYEDWLNRKFPNITIYFNAKDIPKIS